MTICRDRIQADITSGKNTTLHLTRLEIQEDAAVQNKHSININVMCFIFVYNAYIYDHMQALNFFLSCVIFKRKQS